MSKKQNLSVSATRVTELIVALQAEIEVRKREKTNYSYLLGKLDALKWIIEISESK